MKIKILESSGWYKNFVDREFKIYEYDIDGNRLRFKVNGMGWIYESDCVITELPESFCVKSGDDKKWDKYIQWLNKTYNSDFGGIWDYYGLSKRGNWYYDDKPFGTEIHIDDMIKHIDYMERHIKGGEQFHKESQLTVKMDKEFDLTTDEGRLAYAKKYYPIGTRVTNTIGERVTVEEIFFCDEHHIRLQIGEGLIYDGDTNKWAEIIKEETNMQKQKLSRQGLKEIHSVACSTWKNTLEQYGSRNPLEDYIELSQKEIDTMFLACTKDQLPIVSKYLKQDDGSVDVTKFNVSGHGFCDPDFYIIRDRQAGKYKKKSFLLSSQYNWEIKTDELGELCLIPTKKKFSAEKGWVL